MTPEDTLLDLLNQHDPAVRRIADVYAGPYGEEDDLYQEILMQLWRSLPNFRGDSAAGTWLYRVALNTALMWHRHATKRAGAGSGEALGAAEARVSHQSPRSEATILGDFLATLGEPDRLVLILYMGGITHKEIADVTGLSVSAVGVRLHRMKQSFTKRFVEE